MAVRFPRLKSVQFRAAVRYLLSALGVSRSDESAIPSKAKSRSMAVPPAPDIDERLAWSSLFGWAGVRALGREHVVEWGLDRLIARTLREMGVDDSAAEEAVGAIKALTAHQRLAQDKRLRQKAPRPFGRSAVG